MSESLRDQLLRAGLGRKPAEQPKGKGRPGRGRGRAKPAQKRDGSSGAEMDLGKAYALRARAERDAQREAEAQAQARRQRRQELATLLAGKALNDPQAEIARHFPHGEKILRIWVNQEQLRQLNQGELAVVSHRGRFLLVTRETALAVKAIEPRALVLLCDPQAGPQDDVPDDLVW